MADYHNSTSTQKLQSLASGAPGPRPGQLEEMLTAKELQQLLKISTKSLYRYVQQGRIPYVRIQSMVRFPKSQLQEWIKRQTYQPRPPDGNLAKRD
jgi:excisionase family DNA binding protein